jgi:hypothetical protein
MRSKSEVAGTLASMAQFLESIKNQPSAFGLAAEADEAAARRGVTRPA